MRSTKFGLPLICIGNLSVGGTGKSPMVEYLVRLLKDDFKIGILSRGYKRRTKGYALANEYTTALEIGDEPMQFHLKFPSIPVAVGEERIYAIPQLLGDRPELEAIILDDAFQHRAIQAGLNILLTEYGNLFTRDFYLPTGDLRDLKSSYKRAEIIIVTKCEPGMTEADRHQIREEIKPLPAQQVFFTSIQYGQPYHMIDGSGIGINESTEVLLVTGIANPRPLKKLLEVHSGTYYLMQYADHHIFTIVDLKDIIKRFEKITAANKIVLTTEKDAVRLIKFQGEIAGLPIYVMPIRHHFLFGEEDNFNEAITGFIRNFKRSQPQSTIEPFSKEDRRHTNT